VIAQISIGFERGNWQLRFPYGNLARPAGFEPTTPWFVGDLGKFVVLGNQRLAALANPLLSHIKAQFGHSQSELVTDCYAT
jgi:hypothetical protein